MRRLATSLAVVLLVTACGDDGVTEPQPEPTVTGSWAYAAPDMVRGSQTCSIQGLQLTLEQEGATVSGTTAGGTITCVQGSTSITEEIDEFSVSGTLADAAVELNIGLAGAAPVLISTGTLSGNTITGSAVIQDLQGDPFTGSFTATRN